MSAVFDPYAISRHYTAEALRESIRANSCGSQILPDMYSSEMTDAFRVLAQFDSYESQSLLWRACHQALIGNAQLAAQHLREFTEQRIREYAEGFEP